MRSRNAIIFVFAASVGTAMPPAATGAQVTEAEPGSASGAVPDAAVGAMREVTVKILAPWEGKGEVFQIGPEELLFVGRYEGIMYIEGEQRALDSAIITCPAMTHIRQFQDTIDSSGFCNITSSAGDLAFARFTCKGAHDACQGEFIVTGGTGRLEGIEGRGEMVVRTALSSMVDDMETGSLVSSVEGLAVWPALTVRVPGRALESR